VKPNIVEAFVVVQPSIEAFVDVKPFIVGFRVSKLGDNEIDTVPYFFTDDK